MNVGFELTRAEVVLKKVSEGTLVIPARLRTFDKLPAETASRVLVTLEGGSEPARIYPKCKN